MKNVKNKFMRNRRGVIDIQFNWIFVMIAGFVMLLFIISIVFSQKHNSDKRLDTKVITEVATLLKGKQQASSTYSEISFPSTDIRFNCQSSNPLGMGNDDNLFTFRMGNSERIPLPNSIIFAPREFNTNKLNVWTQAFTIGFTVNVFTYITTPNSVILIYNPSGMPTPYAQELYDALPDNITKKMVDDYSELDSYSQYKNVKIVCFFDNDDGCPYDDGGFISNKYGYIEVQPVHQQPSSSTDIFGYGYVTFRGKLGPGGGTDLAKAYIAKAGLFGAIFSDNVREYSCQMDRAMKEVEIKRLLLESRLSLIQNDLTDPSTCRTHINVTLENNILPIRNPILDIDNVTVLGTNAKSLDSMNNLLTISSCPKIY